jgi:hypothetical protein
LPRSLAQQRRSSSASVLLISVYNFGIRRSIHAVRELLVSESNNMRQPLENDWRMQAFRVRK